MRDHNELIGQKFERLMVLSLANAGSTVRYKVRCDCGTEKLVYKKSLVRGDVKSCGCLKLEKSIKRNGETAFKQILWGYKSSAFNRGYLFNLTEEEAKNLMGQNCFYCNIEPSNMRKTGKYQRQFIYNGIDRKDNTIGYEVTNCVPCCSNCNTAKSDMKFEDFINWINRIHKWINR